MKKPNIACWKHALVKRPWPIFLRLVCNARFRISKPKPNFLSQSKQSLTVTVSVLTTTVLLLVFRLCVRFFVCSFLAVVVEILLWKSKSREHLALILTCRLCSHQLRCQKKKKNTKKGNKLTVSPSVTKPAHFDRFPFGKMAVTL